MKKYGMCLFLWLFLTMGIVCASSYKTDSAVFNGLLSAYNSQMYPGAIQYAEMLERDFPDSESLGSALLIKGECLVRLNRFFEAEETLLQAKRFCETNKTLLNECAFWLGAVYEGIFDYDEALKKYSEYCLGAGREKKYYSAAVLQIGTIYFKKHDYKKAIPLFEYVVQNGTNFSSEDYASALFCLMDSYNNSGMSEKTVALFEKISREDFSQMALPAYFYSIFMERMGEACENLGEYKAAYDIYCEILASGEKPLVSSALKKAYTVSSLHKAEVGEDPGTVLESAQKSLADSPELLGEFWTRLGADAYASGEYEKALDYFDEAEKNAPIDLFLFASLYRAQIIAGKHPSKEDASNAEKMILRSRSILNEENSHYWERESYILLARYAALQEDWEAVKTYAANVNPLDIDTKQYLALAEYNTGNYAAANLLLRGQYTDLHGLSLARSGDLKNAALIYSGIAETRGLTDEERLNYAKILLYSGRYKESQIEAAKCALLEAKYILGLAQFNTWSWPYAEQSFQTYLNARAQKDEKSVSYALFYLGYSQYRQGKTVEAYKNLSNFVDRYPQHELFWNAQIAAANSAVQNGKSSLALRHAIGAINSALNDTALEESVLLCADIYSDEKKYRDALNILTPYAGRNSDLGIKAMYNSAQVYEKQGELIKADDEYKNIAKKFPSEKLSDEAMYRRGELYYNAGIFDKAIVRFSEYQKMYPVGNYVDASWYFTAQCFLGENDVERAILQFRALVKRFPKSTYIYSSYKNLVSLYRSKGDGRNAADCAKFLLANYTEQAKTDGINAELSDLEKLNAGKSEAIVQKEAEYEKNGREETALGRSVGTDLVLLYADDAQFERKAISLSEQLLPLQKKNIASESLGAAKNALFLGKCYRRDGRNKEAAEMYLAAAEYFRMNAKDEEAAMSLYGAQDAFMAASLFADAHETARMLKLLYPESRYAKSVKVEE